MADETKVEDRSGEATAPVKVEDKTGEATASTEQTPEDIRSQYDVEGSDDTLGEGDAPSGDEELTLGTASDDSSGEESEGGPKKAEETKPPAEGSPTEPATEATHKTTQHKTADERFAEITEKRYQAEAEAKVLRDRYEALQTQYEQLATAQTPPAKKKEASLTLPKMPTRDSVDFDDEKYAASMDRYQADLQVYQDAKFEARFVKHDAVKQREYQATQAQVQADKTQTDYRGRVSEFSKAHPDYETLVHGSSTSPSKLKAHKAVLEFIREADNGPELAYIIATKPELAEKLIAVSPSQALVDLGKLQVSSKIAAKTKNISGAPDPISPIDSSGNPGTNDLEKMSIGDFMNQRKARYYQA